ncbi:MAG TPA: beta-eliminating lyase-related protein [Actinophytocola sp.]|jgi:threonine aldolase|nr:beta-eliminating lyase-related protein [Actinophytocola sp.]
MSENDIRRSLANHAPLRRRPAAVLRRMLDWLPEDTELFGDDAPVARLERRLAGILGKPAAMFFPSGTMAQQVAIRVHAERTGRRAFVAHPQNHLDLWEEHGYAAVHGLRYVAAGDRHSLLTLDALREVGERPAALLVELPQREIGGLLPTWDDLVAQVAWAHERGAAAHLDGARIWEAQPFYDRPHAEIAGLFDTVYTSLYKGLEGVRGAVLAGPPDVLGEAGVWRRRLGGHIPDAWPLAVAALVGLETLPARMPAFRDHAVAIARALTEDGVAEVRPDPPQTPLFHVHLPVAPADADRAGEELIASRGVQLFSRVQTDQLPGRCKFEVSVGENAMELAPDEVAALVRELVARA